jgi:IPT/TIG domain
VTASGGPGAPHPAKPRPRTMVGAREVQTFGITVIALTLVAAVAWSLYSLWYFWPHVPASTAKFVYFGWHLQLTPDQQFFLTVSLAGALGGLLHSVRSLSTYVGERYLFRSWLLYYLALPLVGAVLATIAYIVLRAGLLPGGASNSQPDPYGIAGISALVGLFSAQTVEKLQTVFSTLFTNAPQNADSLSDLSSGTDDPGDPAAQPAVTALTPASGPAGTEVTVTGRNFGDVTGVAFAGVDAASFTITSPHQLTAVVPPAATTGPITLSGPTPLTTYQLFTVIPPGSTASG